MNINLSVLTNPKFVLFFMSDIISGFGVGMATIGANWFVLMKTDTTASVGMLLAVNVVAGFLASVLSGVLTDRLSRKSLIFWTHFIRAIGITIILIILHTNDFNINYLYAFAAINGIGWTLYMAASRSFLQEILDNKNYVTGNSLLEISLQVGMFLAAGISGFLYRYYSFEIILLVNAIMFIVSAIVIKQIRHVSELQTEYRQSYVQTLKDGFYFLNQHKAIFILGVVSIIPLIVTMIYNVVLPNYVSNTLGKDSVTFGFADMSYGIGGLLSGFLISIVTRKFKMGRLITLFFIIATADLLFLSQSAHVFNLYLCSLLLGLSNSSLRILMNSLLMNVVTKEFMGRAMSVWIGISLIFQCVFSLSIGNYIDHHGAMFGIVIMGLIMGLGLILYIIEQIVLAKNVHTEAGSNI